MKPNELRIGNKVLVNGLHGKNIVMTVDSITGKGSLTDSKRVLFFKEDGNEVGEFAINCQGIKLTQDWLRNLGFEHVGNNDWIKNGLFICAGHHEFWLFGTFDVKLDYVHQLQNLYYVLKGEEL